MTAVRVVRGLADELLARARAALPEEACGVLLGRPGPPAEILRTLSARNVARLPARRFELDPGALVAAEDLARGIGLEVVGVWHSHPSGPAIPSEEDRAGAFGGWHNVIAAPGVFPGELRCYRLEAGRYREERLRTLRPRSFPAARGERIS